VLDGYIRNFACHMRGVDDAQRASPWGYFWAFVPLSALDEALTMMSRLGRAKWPEFHLDRYTFLVWVGVWFRMCADKLQLQGLPTGQTGLPWAVVQGDHVQGSVQAHPLCPPCTPVRGRRTREVRGGGGRSRQVPMVPPLVARLQCTVQGSMAARHLHNSR